MPYVGLLGEFAGVTLRICTIDIVLPWDDFKHCRRIMARQL